MPSRQFPHALCSDLSFHGDIIISVPDDDSPAVSQGQPMSMKVNGVENVVNTGKRSRDALSAVPGRDPRLKKKSRAKSADESSSSSGGMFVLVLLCPTILIVAYIYVHLLMVFRFT